MSETIDYAGPEDPATVVQGPEVTREEGGPVVGMPAVGERLGRYRLVRELGAGGMGVVFEGHDPELDRRVAVKVLRRDGSAEDIARVIREARSVAQLSHPNVVQVFDVSATAGRPYIVMEYVEGMTLSRWADIGQPWKRIAGVFIKAAAGLEAAHAAGLVHRDFKSANVLVTSKRDVKVLDFGLARPDREGAPALGAEELADGLATLTQTGIAMGTPAYMAPEQHCGDPITARADIYAFGVTLYEALYGERPFSARDSTSLLRQKKRGIQAPPPETEVPAELHDAIVRATAFEPDARFASMQAFAATLREIRRRSSRGRRLALWGAASMIVVGAAAVFTMDPTGEGEGPSAATDSVEIVARDVGIEAARLVTLSGEQARNGELAKGLGTAYGAYLVASASQSDSSRGRAELAVADRLVDSGRYGLTQAWIQRGIEHLERAGQGHDVVIALNTRAQALAVTQQEEDATRVLRRASAARDRYQLQDDLGLEVNLLVTEALISEASDPAASIALQEKAVAIIREHPEVVDRRRRGSVFANLGRRIRYSNPPRAAELIKDGIDELVEAAGERQPVVFNLRVTLADTLRVAGQHEACVEQSRRVFDAPEVSVPETRLNAAVVAAACLNASADNEAAFEWADRAVEFAEAAKVDDQFLMQAVNTRAWSLIELGRLEEAERDFLRVLVFREATHESGSVSEVLMLLGRVTFEQNAHERAEAYFRRAVEVSEERRANNAEALHTYLALGVFLVRIERFEEGLASLERGLAIEPPPGYEVGAVLSRAEGFKARALWAAGKKKEAMALAKAAHAKLREQSGGTEHERELADWIASKAND